ncbi:lipopolysaccharide biosynthesis protein [Fulvivirga sedimenti]|uniref:Oligosaccharide flippase family protein n=1 Tax=Fulvivirga sedimenti TaxID=2879465 RepID=A0A9X1HUX7_9BACT|nr:oligosaccharide flippase family protein [Fulvivirga sedimenti]MCA6075223.1 oligosaccharide flippase family protein [Fulvivirga sedimenti]MCA6076400.1 oligosaccharide flippase family protein [Fulvivirga sedimenti]MCA6077528.1 oligosaccharide flippase family protein [Fulvivirga sedimenti]
MGIVRRNSIWLSIIQYLGILLGYVNTVILFPNILDSDQFGLTRILLSVTIVISQFSQLGTPSMIVKYFPYLHRKVLYYGFLICAGGLTLVLSLIWIFKPEITSWYIENSSLFVEYFYLLVPFSIAMVFYNLFDAYLKALFKNVLSASLPFIFLRILWMILILLYAKGEFDFETFIIAYTVSYALIALITLIYIGILGELPTELTIAPGDRTFLKEIRKFNSFNVLSGLSAHMINKVDGLMLGSLESLSSVSIYAIAAAMASVIRVPASSIARTAPSLIAHAFKDNDHRTISELYRKSSINQLILSSGVFLLITLNYSLLLYYIPEEYADSFLIFIMLGLAQVIDTGVGINGYIMVNSKYYKVDAILSVLLLVITVGLNFVFIPLYGTLGAAMATTMAILAYNIARFSFLKIKMDLNPFTGKTMEIVLIMIAAGIICYFLPLPENLWVASILKSSLFLILTAPVIYWKRYSPELSELVDLILDRFRR